MSSRRFAPSTLLLILSVVFVLVATLAVSASPANARGTGGDPGPDKSPPPKGWFVGIVAGPTAISYQDISSVGPLTHIFAGAESSVQVAHAADGTTYEFYPPQVIPGDAGTFIVVDDTLYAPDFSQHSGSATGNLGTYTPFTQVSQTPVSGTGVAANPFQVVTVLDVASTGLPSIQTDSYVVGAEVYRTDIQISNSGTTAKSLIVYRAADCYLGASDWGYGLVNTTQRSVACTKTVNNEPADRGSAIPPLTAGNNYYEARYSEVWSAIGSHQPFPDTSRYGEYIDNGIGLSWSAQVAAGGQAHYAHLTAFSPQGALPLTLAKSADNAASTPRGNNGYTITINNPNPGPVTVTSVSDDLPPGFSYVTGSTSGFTNANPALNGQTLTWNGTFVVPASGSISMHFGVLVSDQPGDYTNDARANAEGYSVSPAIDVAPVKVEVAVSPIDTGFRPDPDGYKFDNWGGLYPLPPELFDYTNADTVAMFGVGNTCAFGNSFGVHS